MNRHPLLRLVASLLAALHLLGGGVAEAYAAHACPHHDLVASHASESHADAHAHGGEPPAPDGDHHGGPCRCAGACQLPGPVALTTPSPPSAVGADSVRLLAVPFSPTESHHPRLLPHFLPPANAPPRSG